MSESRHSKGDAANVESTAPAYGHVDEFRNVPTDEEFVGGLGTAVDLDPEDVVRNARPIDELRLRRERRKELERYRAWAIIVGGLLSVVLMFSPLPGVYAALALLATFLVAYYLRRAGR